MVNDSSMIKEGDFIGADFDSDSDWDHVGFVTDISNDDSNGYYDFKVVQRTSDYHDWASSFTNNWKSIGGDSGTFGRIGR